MITHPHNGLGWPLSCQTNNSLGLSTVTTFKWRFAFANHTGKPGPSHRLGVSSEDFILADLIRLASRYRLTTASHKSITADACVARLLPVIR